MKLLNHNIILMSLNLLFSCIVYTQNNNLTESISKTKDSSYTAISINYINDAVFMGRKDSISAPYLFPSISFYHKTGFYANGSLSYLTKSNESRIDLFLISAGYNFINKKLEGDFSITKYFFNDESYNVISQVEADLTASLEYDFKLIKIGFMASSFFSNDSNIDFILSSELRQDFISKNQKFQISPTVGIVFGSQNFYEQYYKNTPFKGSQGQNQGQGQGGSNNVLVQNNIQINESEKFNLMAFEMGLPIWYVNKSFAFLFAPNIVFPQSPSELIIDNVSVKEELETTFYWMLGVSYFF